jgi:hypothetical protein
MLMSVEMRRVAAIIALAGCSTICVRAQSDQTQVCAARGEFEPAVVISSSGSMVTFKCDRATPLDVVRSVGRQTRIPIGVVLGQDHRALSKSSRSFDLEKVDAKLALLTAIQGTGYSLKEENHVMVLVAGDLTPRQRSLLAYSFSGVSPESNQTMVELGIHLTALMRAVTEPQRGFGSSISLSANEERFTLEGTSAATTEEIADRIVSLGSKGMWIFRADASSTTRPSTDEVAIEPYQHYPDGAAADR